MNRCSPLHLHLQQLSQGVVGLHGLQKPICCFSMNMNQDLKALSAHTCLKKFLTCDEKCFFRLSRQVKVGLPLPPHANTADTSFPPLIMLNYSNHLSVRHEVLGTGEVVTLTALHFFYFQKLRGRSGCSFCLQHLASNSWLSVLESCQSSRVFVMRARFFFFHSRDEDEYKEVDRAFYNNRSRLGKHFFLHTCMEN